MSIAFCTAHATSTFWDEEYKEGMKALRCSECSCVVETRNVLKGATVEELALSGQDAPFQHIQRKQFTITRVA